MTTPVNMAVKCSCILLINIATLASKLGYNSLNSFLDEDVQVIKTTKSCTSSLYTEITYFT